MAVSGTVAGYGGLRYYQSRQMMPVGALGIASSVAFALHSYGYIRATKLTQLKR